MGLVVLDTVNELRLADGIVARVVNSATMSLAHVTIDAGAIVPEHKHPNEQMVNVIEGELELTVEGITHRLTPGKVLIIPPNVPHFGRALSDCKVVDVFHPVREDWLDPEFSGYDEIDS